MLALKKAVVMNNDKEIKRDCQERDALNKEHHGMYLSVKKE
jgi:hypothetical protein